jgi:cytochrome c oxidase cbb3-type subunit 3
MHRVTSVVCLLACQAAGGLFALSAQPAKKPDAAAIERGRSQFKSSCGFCHGDDATGNRAPDLLRSPVLLHDVNGDLVGPVIRNGKPDLGMPGFSNLTAAQISDIVVFLHNQAEEALHSNGVPRDYPLKKLLTGNAETGKAYFNGSGGCARCHSPTGDLAGVARKYSPLDLQQRMLYPGGRARLTATVTLPGGEKMEGHVASNDEFDIAITGPDGAYHSWPKTAVKVEIHDSLAAHRDLFTKYTDADIHNLYAYLATLK